MLTCYPQVVGPGMDENLDGLWHGPDWLRFKPASPIVCNTCNTSQCWKHFQSQRWVGGAWDFAHRSWMQSLPEYHSLAEWWASSKRGHSVLWLQQSHIGVVHAVCPGDKVRILWFSRGGIRPVSSLPNTALARLVASTSSWDWVPLAQQSLFCFDEAIHNEAYNVTAAHPKMPNKSRWYRKSHVLQCWTYSWCSPRCA